jgi:hypothetical protein
MTAWILVVSMMSMSAVITPMQSREHCIRAAAQVLETDPDALRGTGAVCVPLSLPENVCGATNG